MNRNLNLTPEEKNIFDLARRGDWNTFTNHYMRLPASGTYFTPEDRPRRYELLHSTWRTLGEPDGEFAVVVDEEAVDIRVMWMPGVYGGEPIFLLPHGFHILPWLHEFLNPNIPLGIAVAGAGSGKAQPLTAKILTPTGWTTMSEIKVGSHVVGQDGTSKQVLGVYPQGIRPIYRVTFTDGSSTLADNDHLWPVNDVCPGNKWHTVKTDELRGGHFTPAFFHHNQAGHWFASVEYVGDMEAQCISVEDNLYVTDDFIVTHNTANLAIYGLMCCAIFPGYRFLNVAPSDVQARLMLGEIEKWCSQTRFRKFITEGRGANPMWTERPYPTISVEVYPGYPSEFVCQTVKRDATSVLGGERDFICCDEAQLLSGINEAVPILALRMRGTRSTGELRTNQLRWITNPGRNPELSALMEYYRELQDTSGDAIVLEGIDSSANIYLTRHQLRQQELSLRSDRERARWHGGSMGAVDTDSEIGEQLLDGCKSDALDKIVQEEGTFDDSVGLLEYSLPYHPERDYLVFGDVGKSSLVNLSSMNVPCVFVMDYTDFPDGTFKMVAFHWFDGRGDYNTFVRKVQQAMTKFRARAFYDAQSVQTALEDLGGPNTFANYTTTPVFMSGSTEPKSWALSVLIQLLKDQAIELPYIKGLWHQARMYDPSSKKKADDIIATFIVFCLALRIDSSLWDRLSRRYEWAGEEDLNAKEERNTQYTDRPNRHGRYI